MSEEILDDYDEYEENNVFTCMNCGYEGPEVYEQESDLFPGETVLVCLICGACMEI